MKVSLQWWRRGRLRSSMVITLTALVCAICWSGPSAEPVTGQVQAKPPTQDATANDEIKMIIEEYANSINHADPNLASRIWLNSSEVSFVHPLGHEHGFEKIKQNIYQHLMGDTFSERKLNIHDISIHIHGDAAWNEFYWDFSAKFKKDNSPITTHGRETQVYWKTPDGWRLVHVHYSGMPITEERKGF
jgi:ketosteroid isomerase-like protein